MMITRDWRPKGWIVIYTDELDGPVSQSWVWENAYESGASDIIDALLQCGYIKPEYNPNIEQRTTGSRLASPQQ